MRIKLRRIAVALGAGVFVLYVAGAAIPAAATTTRSGHSPAAVLHWNDIAVRTDLAAKQTNQEGQLHLAYVQAAVFDAVDAIDGGYRPYVGNLHARRPTSADAAVAVAAHAVLVVEFPAQSVALDADLAASLAATNSAIFSPSPKSVCSASSSSQVLPLWPSIPTFA